MWESLVCKAAPPGGVEPAASCPVFLPRVTQREPPAARDARTGLHRQNTSFSPRIHLVGLRRPRPEGGAARDEIRPEWRGGGDMVLSDGGGHGVLRGESPRQRPR